MMGEIWPWERPLTYGAMLVLALAWDRFWGEPSNRWHPVVWMGTMIAACRDAAPLRPPAARFVWGALMALLLPVLWALMGGIALKIPVVGVMIGVWLMKSGFSIATLGSAGIRVGDAVAEGRIADAQEGLSWLCSRDPRELSGEELAGAAIESVAENASDSAVAPLLWLMVLGLPGLLAYRCVNTMDAMIGYRDRYFWLGKAAARLDDALNWIPARLTALLLLAATGDRIRMARGWRIGLRDQGQTDSPNAGWPMAVMAGVLGVQLTKRGQYELGDATRPIQGADVRRAWALAERAMLGAAALCLMGWGLLG